MPTSSSVSLAAASLMVLSPDWTLPPGNATCPDHVSPLLSARFIRSILGSSQGPRMTATPARLGSPTLTGSSDLRAREILLTRSVGVVVASLLLVRSRPPASILLKYGWGSVLKNVVRP